MRISWIKAILLLVFWPSRFNRLAREYADAQSKEVNWQFPETPTHEVRKKLFSSFLEGLFAVGAGYVTGLVFANHYGPASDTCIQVLQYLGVAIILWATLAKGGWNIQTTKGESLPEKVDQWIYRLLYLVGSYFLVLSVSWLKANG
jgi:hypothetical protein